MSDSFDPYHLWLGIPPEEQPPDHYRLLALRRFESNPVAISNAADRQMAFVKLHASGPHSAVSQKLLNEIAAARLTLLNAVTKAEYDERLRAGSPPVAARPVAPPLAPTRVTSPSAAPPAELIFASAPNFDAPPAGASPFEFADTSSPTFKPPLAPTTVVPTSAAPTTAGPANSSANSSARPSFATPPDFTYPLAPVPPPRRPARDEPASPDFDYSKIGLAAGVAVILAVVVFSLLDVNDDGSNIRLAADPTSAPWSAPLPPAPHTPPAEPEEAPSPAPEPPLAHVEGPESEKTGPESETPAPESEQPATEATKPAPKFAVPTIKPFVPPTTTSPVLAGTFGPGEWVDLLEWSEGLDWRKHGFNWNGHIDGSATRSGVTLRPPVNLARLPLPAFLHGDYEFEFDVQRVAGERGFGVVFPLGPYNACLHLHAKSGDQAVDGVEAVDGIWSYQGKGNSTTRRPSRCKGSKKHHVAIRVEHLPQDRVKFVIGLDADPDYITWEGNYDSFAFNRAGDSMSLGRLQFWSWLTVVKFENVRLRMLTGTVNRDAFSAADREQDWTNGLVRLVGEPRHNVSTAWASVVSNQMPLEKGPHDVNEAWPLISPDFKFCRDYYAAHGPSRLVSPIPRGAKSFTVVGYNDCSRRTKYKVVVDASPVYESPLLGMTTIRVDLPPDAVSLELHANGVAGGKGDRVNWCYPRYHSVPVAELDDAALDGEPGPLAFTVSALQVGYGAFGHNLPADASFPPPIDFRSAKPCDEFIFAAAASSLTYSVPPGMTRFTAIGYCSISSHVRFVVSADGRQLHATEQAGFVRMDVPLPTGAASLTLKVDDMGNNFDDQAMWCYPRLHRE